MIGAQKMNSYSLTHNKPSLKTIVLKSWTKHSISATIISVKKSGITNR